MEQIFKTVMVTGAGIARPPVRASSIPLWKQYLVFSIFHLEEIQCTQTDPRDDHLNQDKAHLHLQRFSNLSFEFTFNYMRTISIDIALKSPSTKRWRAYNFSPSNLCVWCLTMVNNGRFWVVYVDDVVSNVYVDKVVDIGQWGKRSLQGR